MTSVPTADINPRTDGRRSAAAARRREREREILEATRALFDERGVRDAQIEDIGKEELFALTLVGYLDELRVALESSVDQVADSDDRVRAIIGAFVDYGLQHPAFVDCAQALMRRTGPELLDEISEGAMFRLGRAMSSCLAVFAAILDEGVSNGDFDVRDTTLLANQLYASGLGALQLARVGMLVSEAAPGIPAIHRVTGEQVKTFLVASAVALAHVGI